MGIAMHLGFLPTPGVVEPFFGRPFVGVRESVSRMLLAEVEDPLERRIQLARVAGHAGAPRAGRVPVSQ